MLKLKSNSPSPLTKLAIDLGPLLVFFAAFRGFGLIAATGALVVATLLSLVASYALERKISPMPLVTAIAVVAFGGLTLYLHNDQFIKMKPTFVNLLFASVLLIGNAFGRPMLKYLLGSAVQLTPEGWRVLSNRWGVFFIFLAVVNEAVWRNFPTTFWVDFKVFGMMTLTLLFTMAQLPLLKRTMLPAEKP